MDFQRARSDEQRQARKQVILQTAAQMLAEMPVGELSLNELSRRVGLAKSNVLRYFESREAVLLELLMQAAEQWVLELLGELERGIDPTAPVRKRGDQLAHALAATLIRHRVLCDLISAQPGVLEHNVSVEVILRFKRAGRDGLEALAAQVRRHVPELGEAARTVCLMSLVLAGALWSHDCHSAATLEAYAQDPELAELRLDLAGSLEPTLATLISGTLARLPEPAPLRRRGPA